MISKRRKSDNEPNKKKDHDELNDEMDFDNELDYDDLPNFEEVDPPDDTEDDIEENILPFDGEESEEEYEDDDYEEVEDENYDDEDYDEDYDEEDYDEEEEESVDDKEIEEEAEDESFDDEIEEEIDEIEDEIYDDSEDDVDETTEYDEIDEDNTDQEEINDDETDEDEDEEIELDENYNVIKKEKPEEIEEEEEEPEHQSIYPDELVDIELECIFIGLLFNNPKAISRFWFKYEECLFSDDELQNLYKIVLFRDGEQYASAKAKDKFQLPRENPNTYELRLKVKKIASAKNYNLENVYIELKKLFILKKNYIVAPTAAIQEKILEIQNYELYADMSVEEVESALDQITVTTGLSQGRLNEDTTSFLLSGETELTNGVPLPFNILSTVFKGLRRGETMCYAMHSNSGKSRFTINLAAYLSFVHHEKVLIISNEMSVEKMRLCMITTILNNPDLQKLHGQKIKKSEGELLELKFRPDKGKKVKCDEEGYILRKEGETQQEFIDRLASNSKEFNQTIAVTEWVNKQLNNSIYFIHITEHTNDDLKKIIMNYYYKEGIHYMFYDTLKADTDNIGNGEEVKKTATILSNLAQKFKIFIASSMQLLESSTLPVNLTINDMSASRTAKEVLDTLCLIKQISRRSLYKYEYSDTDLFENCKEIDVPRDTDVRFYACVVDKNRAGAKPTVLFKLNLAYNTWEELGHLRLKQEALEEE